MRLQAPRRFQVDRSQISYMINDRRTRWCLANALLVRLGALLAGGASGQWLKQIKFARGAGNADSDEACVQGRDAEACCALQVAEVSGRPLSRQPAPGPRSQEHPHRRHWPPSGWGKGSDVG